jgi:hypothetical protein
MRSERHTLMVIRRVAIALWLVAALWVVREVAVDDDTDGLDQNQIEQELDQLGG